MTESKRSLIAKKAKTQIRKPNKASLKKAIAGSGLNGPPDHDTETEPYCGKTPK